MAYVASSGPGRKRPDLQPTPLPQPLAQSVGCSTFLSDCALPTTAHCPPTLLPESRRMVLSTSRSTHASTLIRRSVSTSTPRHVPRQNAGLPWLAVWLSAAGRSSMPAPPTRTGCLDTLGHDRLWPGLFPLPSLRAEGNSSLSSRRRAAPTGSPVDRPVPCCEPSGKAFP